MSTEIKNVFDCNRCGYCCHGQTTVSLDANDLKNMMEFLQLSESDLIDKYLIVNNKVVQMKTVDGHCVFYKDGCSVHPGRPWRCKQWPFHPSILIDENNFTTIKESCPGIQESVSYEDFCNYMNELKLKLSDF